MRHPDACARLLRPASTWREPFENRGSRGHDALSFEDACLALGGASPLASAAFLWCYCGDTTSRRILEAHLLGLVGELSNGITPAELVALALDEQHAPQAQRKDSLRALVLGIEPGRWGRLYMRPHARLLAEIDSLVGDAWRVARSRLDAA